MRQHERKIEEIHADDHEETVVPRAISKRTPRSRCLRGLLCVALTWTRPWGIDTFTVARTRIGRVHPRRTAAQATNVGGWLTAGKGLHLAALEAVAAGLRVTSSPHGSIDSWMDHHSRGT